MADGELTLTPQQKESIYSAILDGSELGGDTGMLRRLASSDRVLLNTLRDDPQFEPMLHAAAHLRCLMLRVDAHAQVSAELTGEKELRHLELQRRKQMMDVLRWNAEYFEGKGGRTSAVDDPENDPLLKRLMESEDPWADNGMRPGVVE